jgi:hypothetical protein
MKTFVLAAVILSPAALSAQVLPSPSPAHPAPVLTLPQMQIQHPGELPLRTLAAERAIDPPRTDYKLRVVRPSTARSSRMLVARPDDRFNYKILTPEKDPPARVRPKRADGRR